MTVKEMIGKLGEYPPDTLVVLEDDDGQIDPIDGANLIPLVVTTGWAPDVPYYYRPDDFAARHGQAVQPIMAVMLNR